MATQDIPEATVELKKSLLEAVHTLKQLTSHGKVTKDVIAEAKGLVFLFSTKSGIVLSGTAGTGIAIAKLESGAWSAPLPLVINGVGLGVVLGYEEQRTLVALAVETDFDAFKQDKQGSRLGVDFGATVGKVDAGAKIDVDQTQLPKAAKVFAINKGILVDVSMSDTSVSVDKLDTHKTYGQHVKVATVLEGGVLPPADAQELYAALQAVVEVPAS